MTTRQRYAHDTLLVYRTLHGKVYRDCIHACPAPDCGILTTHLGVCPTDGEPVWCSKHKPADDE